MQIASVDVQELTACSARTNDKPLLPWECVSLAINSGGASTKTMTLSHTGTSSFSLENNTVCC